MFLRHSSLWSIVIGGKTKRFWSRRGVPWMLSALMGLVFLMPEISCLFTCFLFLLENGRTHISQTSLWSCDKWAADLVIISDTHPFYSVYFENKTFLCTIPKPIFLWSPLKHTALEVLTWMERQSIRTWVSESPPGRNPEPTTQSSGTLISAHPRVRNRHPSLCTTSCACESAGYNSWLHPNHCNLFPKNCVDQPCHI